MKNSFFFIIAGLLILCSCNKNGQGKNFLYDMGPQNAPAEKGYLRISPSMLYDVSKGCGWLYAPSSAFDTANEKLHNRSLRDGVWRKDSLIFKAAVPNGDYYLTLSLGNKDSIPMTILVSVNGKVFSDTVNAPWYRLAYRSIRRKISVKDQAVIIQLKGIGTDVGLYAVELRASTDPDVIHFSSELEEDTATVKLFRRKLLQQLNSDTTDVQVVNQLDLLDKYLLACSYYDGGGWSWASKETGFSLIYRMYAAADLLEQVIADPADPLYDRALYLLARIYYWLDQEDSNSAHEQKAAKYFSLLADKYPQHQIISMYLGSPIEDVITPATQSQAPRWAVYQHEAVQRMLKVIHWWVTQKQAANGELGGKYGDDVEILRWWLPAILGVDDSLARAGYTKLADGVWNSGILERGFAKRVDDVEHSAELFRDTHPGMFLINYGDPEYVERCLISMQNFRDVWTGITSHGHRHFRSYYLSATEVVPQYPYGVDVAMNARALLPGLWAAWYNQNPSIVQLFGEWCKAWIEDAESSANGKPAGVLPSAVAYEGDIVGGDSPRWYDPALTYSYYNWDHLGHVNELQYHLMGMYAITQNAFYLRTVNFYKDLIIKARRNRSWMDSVRTGNLAWVKEQLLMGGADHDSAINPMGKVFAMAKQLTQDPFYDSLVKVYGQPYNQYSISADTAIIEQGLQRILQRLRYNFPLLTSEVKFTDRVYIPGINLLAGMYTGHFGAGYEFPSLISSWKNTGKDVAVFVQQGDSKNIKALLYNFGHAKTIGMRSWQLHPGRYEVKMGADRNKDGVIDEQISDTTINLDERVNDLAFWLPAGREIILSVKQLKDFEQQESPKADLAIAPADIKIKANGEGLELQAVIHNIGNSTAHNSQVILYINGKAADSMTVSALEAPNDLKPRLKQVIFKLKPNNGSNMIQLKIMGKQPEITTLNNAVTLTVKGFGEKATLSF